MTTTPPDTAETPSAFATEAATFREVLAAGRSAVFLRLFDFLVERSNDERAPKEVEIALAVFGKDGGGETLQDSAVRVYVHRLRKRLDEHYASKPGPRLQILKGEYRVVLSVEATPQHGEGLLYSLRNRVRSGMRWWVAIALVIVANVFLWWVLLPSGQASRRDSGLAETAFWKPLVGKSPVLMVAGDAFMLAETNNQKDISRMILDPEIRSRGDFGGYLMNHPDSFYTLYDLDLHYTPIGTAKAVWNILPTVNGFVHGKSAGTQPVSASRLKAQALEEGNVVYVGSFANMGILASPLFQTSEFKMAEDGAGLLDRSSGKLYAAPASLTKDQEPYRDYGYIAAMPGPSGHHILIVSGIGDIGILSMAELVNDKAQLDDLAKRIGAQSSFEALFEVRALGNTVMSKTLVVARPLRSANSPSRQ